MTNQDDGNVAIGTALPSKSYLNKPIQQSDRINVLDGWRTVSVGLVIFSHLLLQSSVGFSDQSSVFARKVYIPLIEGLGYVGVDIFFVISGFVICRGFMRESRGFGRISLSAFYVRRSFRILPPLVVYISTVIALSYFQLVDSDAKTAIRALTFTCNVPIGSCGGWLGGHTWSLSVEEQFYLVIPLAFSALSVHRGRMLTSFAIVLPIVVLGLDLIGQAGLAKFLGDFTAIGAGVACALNERRVCEFVESAPRWLFYAAVAGILFLARLHNTRLSTVATVALAMLISFLLLESMKRDSRVNKWLCVRPMLAIGKASYGLYLWQQLATYPFPGEGVSFYLWSLTSCFLVVFASYWWFERPLIRIGAAISHRLQGAGCLVNDPGCAN
jgi:peptidoglycan/LPS O-acetylase OafA/YrhL